MSCTWIRSNITRQLRQGLTAIGTRLLDSLLDDLPNLLLLKGLLDVVEGASFDRGHGVINASKGCDHNDRHLRVVGRHRLQDDHAVDARHL